jgi:hypothetical protein
MCAHTCIHKKNPMQTHEHACYIYVQDGAAIEGELDEDDEGDSDEDPDDDDVDESEEDEDDIMEVCVCARWIFVHIYAYIMLCVAKKSFDCAVHFVVRCVCDSAASLMSDNQHSRNSLCEVQCMIHTVIWIAHFDSMCAKNNDMRNARVLPEMWSNLSRYSAWGEIQDATNTATSELRERLGNTSVYGGGWGS